MRYAIQEMDLSPLSAASTQQQKEDIISTIVWHWFSQNLNRDAFRVSLWFIRKTVKIRDLYPVFVMIFKEPPFNVGV